MLNLKERQRVLDIGRLRIAGFTAVLTCMVVVCIGCDNSKRPVGTQTEPYRLHGVNFGPYLKGQDPASGSSLSVSQLDSLMRMIAPHTRWIRTFGCSNGLQEAGRIAHEHGLKAACGAWLSSNSQTNEEEVASLISAASKGWVDLAIVGSEVLVRGDLTEAALLGYIDRVRAAVADSIPVTTADVDDVLLRHPAVIAAVDLVFANYYPFWAGVNLDSAVAAVHTSHQRLVRASGDKQVVVSETGWPSCGTSVGNAVPSPENAGRYFVNMVSWARANDVDIFYFEAFDERWKAHQEGPQGACWGIWDEDRNMKQWMRKTFEGVTVPDNWTKDDISGDESRPAIALADVSQYGTHEDFKGQVWYVEPADCKVTAHTITRGNWWTESPCNRPPTTISLGGSWIADVTSGGINGQTSSFLAFQVQNSVDPPLAGGWKSLPSSISYDAAQANTEMNRYQ